MCCRDRELAQYNQIFMLLQVGDNSNHNNKIQLKLQIFNSSDAFASRAAVDSDLILSRVKPMTLTLVFTASLLDAQH